MYVRTRHTLGSPMVVLHDLTSSIYWRAVDALSINQPNARHLQEVLVFDAVDSEPYRRIWADILTPEAAAQAWQKWLLPPVHGAMPIFSPDAIARVANGYSTHFSAPIDDPEGPSPTLRILTSGRHIDWQASLSAVRFALIATLPDIGDHYPAQWEFDVPDGYGWALFQHYEMTLAAQGAETRHEHLALRAQADQYWMENVLPLKTEADETRRIYETAEAVAVREISWAMEDKTLESGSYHGSSVTGPSPQLVLAEPDKATAVTPVTRQDLYRLEEIAEQLHDLLGLDPEPALHWLRERIS